MAADLEMQEIAFRLTTELRPRVDAVQQTQAWTREGKRAPRGLKQFLAELRGLAIASGQQCAIDGVDQVRLFILGNVMRRKSCRTGTVLAASIKAEESLIQDSSLNPTNYQENLA